MQGGKSSISQRHRRKQRLSYSCSSPDAVNSSFKRSDHDLEISFIFYAQLRLRELWFKVILSFNEYTDHFVVHFR